eukprot:scaffold590_cov383-Prasinococcus_capsulatus_cf.AAC.8
MDSCVHAVGRLRAAAPPRELIRGRRRARRSTFGMGTTRSACTSSHSIPRPSPLSRSTRTDPCWRWPRPTPLRRVRSPIASRTPSTSATSRAMRCSPRNRGRRGSSARRARGRGMPHPSCSASRPPCGSPSCALAAHGLAGSAAAGWTVAQAHCALACRAHALPGTTGEGRGHDDSELVQLLLVGGETLRPLVHPGLV